MGKIVDITAPALAAHDEAQRLRASLTDCDALAQGAGQAIVAMAKAARHLLALDAGSLVLVRTLLCEIGQRAAALENDINAEAERNSANCIDKQERQEIGRLWDQHHALHSRKPAGPGNDNPEPADDGDVAHVTH